MKKIYFWLLGIFLVGALVFFTISGSSANSFPEVKNFDGEIKLYKSGSCGCCGVYQGYFAREGNSNLETINLESLDDTKRKYGVPSQMESCHTIMVGNYFVEGHIPLEAVEKLLREKPNIKGIAMPGMPSGSPGMPGAKSGDFVIYQVKNDGSYEEWTRL